MHSEWVAPIIFERSYPCGPADDFNGYERKYQLDLELKGQTLSLIGGQRGTLAIDASQLFAIDVQRADTNVCCHFEGGHWQHLLIRRVLTP
jgi:hypothetical protein